MQQVFGIEREVTHLKKGITTVETVYGVTSQSPEKTGPQTILSQNRKHWSVENTQHDVLDLTFDEDRSQIRSLNGPMVMTCLRRSAISLLRMKGITNIAQAFRWLWAKPHVAIRMALPYQKTLMKPLTYKKNEMALTEYGTHRILDLLSGEQLPRIC